MNRTFSALIIAALLMTMGCSSKKSTPTAPNIVTAPDMLTVTVQNSTSNLLNWNDNSENEDGFRIERVLFGGGNWAVVATVAQNIETFLDTGLVEGTVYSYYVRAFDGGDLSLATDTLNAGTRLLSPMNILASGESVLSVALTWEDMSNVESNYRVERKAGNGRFVLVANLPPNSTVLHDSGLVANSPYTYRVRAARDSLLSEWSDEATTRTFQFPPNSPIQLRANVSNVNTVQLTWRDNSLDEEGFKVERTRADNIDWQVIAQLASASTAYSDTALAEGTSYQYRVCSFIGGSNSVFTAPVTAVTSLYSPINLVAARESETSISLSWQDVSVAELGYQVSRRLGLNPFQNIGSTLSAGTEALVDINLTSDVTYTYRIRAVRDTVSSAWSNEASAHTTLRTPNPPSGLVAEGNFSWINEARLTWTDNSSGERNERGFVVQKSPNGSDDWTFVDTIAADVTTAAVTNLSSESTWYFQVSTFNEYGISAFSNVASCVIAGLPPAPSGLTAEGSALAPGGAILRWTDNSLSETAFIIDVSENGNNGWTMHDSIAGNSTTWIVRNLPVESTRFFRILSRNAAGRSAYANTASAEIVGIPPSPSSLVGSAPDYRAVILDWRDNSRSELGFQVERRDAGSFYWRLVRTTQPGVIHAVDSTVAPERSYVYRVRGYNDAGQSDATNEVTVDVPPNPPLTPTDLTVTAIDIDKIELGWYDRAINETSYFVERKGPDDDDFRMVGVFEANVNFMQDVDCVPDSWYTYRVYAENNAGASEISDTAGAQTWPLELFAEDFEGHNLDSSPGNPWTTVATGTSWAHVSDSLIHGGDKSLHFNDPDSGFNRVYSFANAGAISKGTVTAWLYLPHGTNFDFFGANAATQFTFQVRFGANDSLQVWNGPATLDQWGAYPVDEWFKLDIVFDMGENTYQVFINDEVVCDPSAHRASGQALVGGIAWEAYAWNNMFIDDITIVRAWDPPRMLKTNLRPVRQVNFQGVSPREFESMSPTLPGALRQR